MFFSPQDTPAGCLNIVFVFSASSFEDCQWRRYGKFYRYVLFFLMVFSWNAPFQWDVVFSFRIFIVWTAGNEGLRYGWKTCCFWINYNAEHWRWVRDHKMSVLSVVIVPCLFLETYLSHNMCSLTACVQVKLWNMLCDSWHRVAYSIFVMIYDVIHLQLCQATSS